MAPPKRGIFLSVESMWRLVNACRPIEDAFGGEHVWLVGSCLTRPDYRDVDLRLILDNGVFGRVFHSPYNDVDGKPVGLSDQFRMLLQTAISGLLRETTGLPIDFQIQSQHEADYYNDHGRHPVILRPYIQWRPYTEDAYKPRWMED